MVYNRTRKSLILDSLCFSNTTRKHQRLNEFQKNYICISTFLSSCFCSIQIKHFKIETHFKCFKKIQNVLLMIGLIIIFLACFVILILNLFLFFFIKLWLSFIFYKDNFSWAYLYQYKKIFNCTQHCT